MAVPMKSVFASIIFKGVTRISHFCKGTKFDPGTIGIKRIYVVSHHFRRHQS